MVKGIIFDMDGVLFDTEPFYLKRREAFLTSKGIRIDHLSPKDFIGGNLQQIWDKVLAEQVTANEARDIAAAYEDYKLCHKPPYQELMFKEVKSCLKDLKGQGLKLALASNSSRCDILLALESSHIKAYFDLTLAREDVTAGKPNPEIYNKAAQALGLAKEELVVIEDSQKGIAAAKAAGLKVLAIKDKRYGIDQGQADQCIDSIKQLCELLR
ncbi:HAD family hydrolase [Streptococcus equi]|uniref:Phosphorylated carbohydrates phosphatase n=1 Tax=Streptococcus equi subsp. equi TaxID=148942 RepID=A0A380JQV5_9STRE|nr:HAD family phosphatase [Streptococcus equi]MCD3454636.1 HAD family phosphatase [Streptococcus equi subsp. zooepidemicus]WKF65879.1 HAD family phosphatase [Streptococcus equi subsp. zooepidemicus]SUN47058.1 phosphorylated carbohydrates phosphatase [Streptococcus equi subsp. equi]HEL0027134.1 HAD family phosphatase [Streptococcus equi subsp. zooepidemicus]HEL0668111.1 HAD family phosphatase [Streptococcus equi subsp. zooepidemicus]